MLVLKSFDMIDEEGMNDCLSSNVLAEKSAVFVSNGRIVLQVDDGKPMTKDQKIVEAQENINKKRNSIEIITHGDRVNDVRMDNVEEQILKLETDVVVPGDKKAYDSQKTNEKALAFLKSKKDEFMNIRVGNKAQIDDINVEIDIYEQTLHDLRNFSN